MIINSGEIKTLENGYISIATTVINEGTLVANSGTVAMVAADEVVMDLGGVVRFRSWGSNRIQQKGNHCSKWSGDHGSPSCIGFMASAINHGDIALQHLIKTKMVRLYWEVRAYQPSGIEIDGTVIVSSDYAKGGKSHLQIELRCEIRLILQQMGKLEEGKFSSEVISGEVEAIRLQLWLNGKVQN